MRCVVSGAENLAAGERKEIYSSPMTNLFKLNYVVVPDDDAFDPETGAIRLLYHHEQIVPNVWGSGYNKSIPPSVVFRPETYSVQQLSFFPQHYFEPGARIHIGLFENVSNKECVVHIGIVGLVEDCRSKIGHMFDD